MFKQMIKLLQKAEPLRLFLQVPLFSFYRIMYPFISFLIYWFTVDNILEMLFEYLLGENPYAILSLAPTRMAAFYIIGIILNLNNTVNTTISIGVSLILLAIDMLFFFKKNCKG